MTLPKNQLLRRAGATLAGLALVLPLAACTGSSDPLSEGNSGGETKSTRATDSIVIGTANFPESEIIGQIWAETLRNAGFEVEVKSGIGSRDVYLKALQEGSVDIVPEYSGNLAQYFMAAENQELPVGATEEQVLNGLNKALPAGLATGKAAPGESKDSYRVTRELADQAKLVTLADLDNLDDIRIASNPELKDRPYGPSGLEELYNIKADKMSIIPISDSGGPLTIAALTTDKANVANVYTTSPTFDTDGAEIDLVTLEDPENLILPQHILPLMQGKAVSGEAREAITKINADLTTDALLEMNIRNIGPEKADPKTIARDFVTENS
ncbi:ABC transporter substrate-binding protein [Corynebacterium sp. CCM 9185]|uniref:ABC transporter substrate-binding protein n=1 Tax=Corynebacterium marambiense TaxID=2765364 RepID=A0ABS0VWX0_9CORY|nr:ABC transporter substrate-binding protein [Corynebacterium marambiense]MBI9001268.1 ABC transporter substrate-binding protein [Corynebacterium marambiense]MCK7663822.1 ABC transporter substrate-binding protein [Corynebacterium marambiense]MCX7542969.1 ABC transporter substrate-binding protein [Corynebacterium marambiense]